MPKAMPQYLMLDALSKQAYLYNVFVTKKLEVKQDCVYYKYINFNA